MRRRDFYSCMRGIAVYRENADFYTSISKTDSGGNCLKIAVLYDFSRASFSFGLQLNYLIEGLVENGVTVKLNPGLGDALKNYDVAIWWAPFRTWWFETQTITPVRYTRLQLMFNPIDTNEISNFVLKRVKNFVDYVIAPSEHNVELWRKHGVKAIKVPHMLDPKMIPNDCELNDNLYYVETRSFTIRRGTDIAINVLTGSGLKPHTIKDLILNYTEFLKEMCKAGNMVIPARGGAFEIEALEALAMGMRVYYSERKIFDYITDLPPTFRINGEYCITEYVGDRYQVGCYDNVLPVELLPDLPKPNARYYLKEYDRVNVAKKFLEVLDHVDM